MSKNPQSYAEVIASDCCRYIEGDTKDGTAVFCGGARTGSSAYCDGHKKVCIDNSKRKRMSPDDIPLEPWRSLRAGEAARRNRRMRGAA